jgi:hypothetical protein
MRGPFKSALGELTESEPMYALVNLLSFYINRGID